MIQYFIYRSLLVHQMFIHWPYPHFASFSTAPHVACRGQLLSQPTSCFLFHLPLVIRYQTTENLRRHPISWIFQSQLREYPNPPALHPALPSAGHLWIRSALPGMWHTLNEKIYIIKQYVIMIHRLHVIINT